MYKLSRFVPASGADVIVREVQAAKILHKFLKNE